MAITIFGLVLSLVGAAFVAAGSHITGAIVLILSGLCDALDGSLARREGRVTTFGAFVDSNVDRITEIAYFGALIFYFLSAEPAGRFIIFILLVAIAGSFLTSYARARAEGLGLECRVGWLERPERIVLLILGLLLGRTVLIAVILFLAVLTVVTFMQRVLHVRRVTSSNNRDIK